MRGRHEREFVDTNILVYAYDSTAGEKRETAKSLLLSLWKKGTGCLSVQVLQEFYVTMSRKVPNPLPSIAIANIICDLTSWKVHSPKPEDVLEAVALHQAYRISFWDAMIIQSARRLRCTLVWSEDLNNGAIYEGIKVVNPFLG